MFLVGCSLTRSFVFLVPFLETTKPTVDDSEILHPSICGFSHYLQGSLYPSWRSPDLSWNFHFWGHASQEELVSECLKDPVFIDTGAAKFR